MIVEQGSIEWKRQRAGKFTASRFFDLLRRNKDGKRPKAYHDCIWDVVVERLSGQPVEGPTGFALQWGTDVEPFARDAYELHSGHMIEQVGFIDHPAIPNCGGSPDGLIGTHGGIEIKCPKSSAVHLQRFIDGAPSEYVPQMQGLLWITGRDWWRFVSLDPRMPDSHRLLIIPVERNEKMIAEIAAEVQEAEEAAQRILAQIMERKAA